MEESEEGDYRKIRQVDREIRLIRSYGKSQQTFTGPLRKGNVTYTAGHYYRNLHVHRRIRT